MNLITIKLAASGRNIRQFVCPHHEMDEIKEWMRLFYPVSCKIIRREDM